ncbi:hypothetical protein [Paraliomyxa miuraensis]|uniref:hypothetical protein n=1 Tax=Paraliomyxa miuraensis TaxID=376150 RepID=UPI002251AE7D|nr:hypothetical protein [Paraliomyxa miuraensis]
MAKAKLGYPRGAKLAQLDETTRLRFFVGWHQRSDDPKELLEEALVVSLVPISPIVEEAVAQHDTDGIDEAIPGRREFEGRGGPSATTAEGIPEREPAVETHVEHR